MKRTEESHVLTPFTICANGEMRMSGKHTQREKELYSEPKQKFLFTWWFLSCAHNDVYFSFVSDLSAFCVHLNKFNRMIGWGEKPRTETTKQKKQESSCNTHTHLHFMRIATDGLKKEKKKKLLRKKKRWNSPTNSKSEREFKRKE